MSHDNIDLLAYHDLDGRVTAADLLPGDIRPTL